MTGGNRSTQEKINLKSIMTKQEYREKMSTLRYGLKQAQVTVRSQKVTEKFFSLPGSEDYSHYLVYLPINNEVDTRLLLSRLFSLDKNVYVPRCHSHIQGRMDYFRISNFSDLRQGYCGIDEPCPESSALFLNQAEAMCILPGLAFDRKGFRLGYGRGYFDRYLKFLDGPMPVLTGFAYDFQIVDFLPVDEWDIPVHMVITDKEIIFAEQQGLA